MQKLLTLAGAALLLACAGCARVGWNGSADSSLNFVTNVTQTASLPTGLAKLEVENHFGFIHVTGVADSSAKDWSWTLTIRAKNEALAKEAAEASTCRMTQEGNRLGLLVVLPKSSRNVSFESDLEIRAPKSVALLVKNGFGKTVVTDMDADIDAKSASGAIELNRITGRVLAQTSFASLTAEDTGPAILKNQSGPILVEHIRGYLNARTEFGPLTAHDIEGAATLHNQSGRIEVSNIEGLLDATTSFATLDAQEIGGNVKLRNQSGGINLARVHGNADARTSFASLSVRDISGDAVLQNQSGKVNAEGVSGSLRALTSFAHMDVKGAGSSFVCRNQSGGIRLQATSASLRRIVAETSFAPMELTLPSDIKPVIRARTSFADIKSDYPVLSKLYGRDFAELTASS